MRERGGAPVDGRVKIRGNVLAGESSEVEGANCILEKPRQSTHLATAHKPRGHHPVADLITGTATVMIAVMIAVFFVEDMMTR